MKPLVIAHRGASAYAPENTLAAFNLAFEMSADGVELDVTLTRDGVPVIIHDDNVDRTTDGHGAIKAMTLAEVKRLDAGAWFDAKFRGAKIPTLAEVLETTAGRGTVNIELKSTTLQTDGLEATVAKVIDDTHAGERVMVSSFNPFALYRMAILKPQLPRGLLYADRLPLYLRRTWLRPIARPNALHPVWKMIDERLVKWARGKGYEINTWTVDDPEEMRRLIALGVDAIMTNKPDVLRQIVG
ncbi:MAG: glycerophosphodiester phosphodiesterase [Chloroflexota bacterium]|nr:glycerophosphodiester phosphodiesterase [Chloroflexota bacterium]